jgi:HlyD family secretion protein
MEEIGVATMTGPAGETHKRPALRILLWAGGAVAVAGATAFGFTRLRSAPPPRFETEAVDRGPLVAKVTATGTLSALVTVQVGAQVSGRIIQLLVDYNSVVKKGDLIARIDPEIFDAAVAQTRANLLSAEAAVGKAQVQLIDAERLYKRQKELREKNLVAQQDADTAETNFLAAKAQLKADQATVAQVRAALVQAEVNLKYTKIYAPNSGTVIQRNVDVGQTVASAFQAPVLFTIAEDLTHMQVDTSIAEADVGKLSDGIAATFTVDAYRDDVFTGKIRQIRNAPQTLQNVVTYDAVIDVDNKDLKLRPGMTANVTVVWAERKDALRLSNAALRFRPPPDLLKAPKPSRDAAATPVPPALRTVWVLRGDRPEAVKVRVGVTDGTTSEILEGPLKAGDAILTGVLSGQSAAAAKMRSPF